MRLTLHASNQVPFSLLTHRYWQSFSYGDDFTRSALNSVGAFTASASPVVSAVSQEVGAIGGALYQNTLMFAIHKMEQAISDCQTGNSGGQYWDEAVAFYVGSIPGASGDDIGVMQYALAEERCVEFDTCSADSDTTTPYKSSVNNAVLTLFKQGKIYGNDLRCTDLDFTKEDLVTQFMIPMIQGVYKYLYLVSVENSEEQRANLYSFCTALLPYVNTFSPSVAATLKANCDLTSSPTIPDGPGVIKAALESLYSSMRINCAVMGGFVDGISSGGITVYHDGMEPCEDVGIKNMVGYLPSK